MNPSEVLKLEHLFEILWMLSSNNMNDNNRPIYSPFYILFLFIDKTTTIQFPKK